MMLRRLALSTLVVAGVATSVFAQDAGKGDLAAPAAPAAPAAGGQAPPPPAGLGPRAGAAAQPAQPQIEKVADHNGWQVQCAQIPAQNGQPAIKNCAMTRTVATEDGKSAALLLFVRRGKDAEGKMVTEMQAQAPIGVLLPNGVAMEIDGTALPGRMGFVRCIPQFCLAEGRPQDETLKKFSKGKTATFYIYDRPDHGFPMKFPLSGFAEGIADLDKQLPAK